MANTTNRRKSTSGGKKAASNKAQTKSRRTPEPEPEEDFLPAEVFILASFAAAVLLFLSNFRLCGTLGGVLRSVQLGLFGMVGFVAPILIFIGTCFALANRGNRLAGVKLAAVIVGVWVVSGLAELIFGAGYVPGQKLTDIYVRCAENGLGGGLLGGILVMGTGSLLGTIGAYLILLALLVICAVCITERSVVSVVKRGGGRAYQYAKEDADRRRVVREEKKEERRRLREEQKVRGVNLNSTKLQEMPGGDADGRAEEAGAYGREGGLQGRDAYAADEFAASGYDQDGYQADDPGYESDGDDPAAWKGRGPRLINGNEREFDPEIGNQEFMDELLPKEYHERSGRAVSPADVFTGNITRPPVYIDPEDDSVPFDVDTLPADSYRYGLRDDDAWERRQESEAGVTEYASGDDLAESAGGSDRWEAESGGDGAEAVSGGDGAEAVSGGDMREPLTVKEKPAPGGMDVIGGVVTLEEGTKRVVTASGKIIESDTETLQKKLESRRAEAREEKFAGADAAAARSLGRDGAGSGGQAAGAGSVSGEAGRQQAAAQKPKPVVKKKYIFPPLNLLTRSSGSSGSATDKEYRETAIKLQQTLRDFGVGVTVTNVSCGPSVTRYELHPEQGVKVSRIVGLADDIKLSLAAADIRIEAPIPGKSAVGIEVPNKEKNAVGLRELLESEAFRNSQSKLTFAVGKDIGGQVIVADIAKMPHMLIAGATGSGKSVCINTLIISIIYKASPEDVKLIMVDPKVVELSSYNGIPHLLIPVVTDPKKASGALNWAVAEMDDRYKKFAAAGVRDLKGYNAKVEAIGDVEDENKPVKMPQIVIIIDELADLMMVAPGEVEDSICRLAQLARAAGIHLVIATQRPSVNVITGLIKANVPSRIAFAVSSGVDSRTILDMVGAEKLLGKGDMLFYPAGIPKPLRVQGALVTDGEVAKVVDFLKNQGMDADYDANIENQISMPAADAGGEGRSDRDEYFAQAGRFIIEKDKASIGMLQRMYKIGFNRAARIMDQLAEAGVVGEDEGTKPRKILMTAEEFEAYLNG